MSEEALINLIHAEVMRVLHRTSRRTPVVVDGYDAKTHAAKFKLMPESIKDPVVTGWIPLHTGQTGNKAGHYMPPNIGDHGWLEFSDDDREGGTFTHAAFNDKFPPDDTVKAGENKYIQPNTQAQIYLDNDGNVTIRGMNTSNANSGNNKGSSGGSDNSKQTVILKKDGSTVATDKSGNATLTLDGNGNFVIACKKYTINASDEIDLNCTKVVINGGTIQVETIQSGTGTKDLLVRPNGNPDPAG